MPGHRRGFTSLLLPLCGTVTLGKSLPLFFESQFDYLQHGVTPGSNVGRIWVESPRKMVVTEFDPLQTRDKWRHSGIPLGSGEEKYWLVFSDS